MDSKGCEDMKSAMNAVAPKTEGDGKATTISVIIPCYNCQEHIEEALQSLTQQTFLNFEAVCVNDGSTDDTLSVLYEWQQRGFFPIKIINQENGGVSRARNAGIKAACGEFIVFLDADDGYHPTYIEQLYTALQSSGADVAYCRLSRDADVVSRCSGSASTVFQTQQAAMHNLLYRMPEFGFYCYLYKKEILDREHLEFDEDTRHFEDREFNWKYLCHCQSAVLVDAPLYFYRVNEHSVTQNRTVQWHTDRLDAVRRTERYLEEKGCPYLPELQSYLFPRVMWSMAKNYSLGGEIGLLKRLGQEYDVKTCMKRTARDSNKLVALASRLYLIHPSLFYYIVRLKK